MLDHALSDPASEVCGLIGGNDDRACNIYPVKNIAESPKDSFFMDPQDQIATMRLLREKNEILWGIYHSHPDTQAIPSQRDLDQAAYPGVFYFIISLVEDSLVLNAYEFDGEKFEKINLEIK